MKSLSLVVGLSAVFLAGCCSQSGEYKGIFEMYSPSEIRENYVEPVRTEHHVWRKSLFARYNNEYIRWDQVKDIPFEKLRD
jgi:hypothetical protein